LLPEDPVGRSAAVNASPVKTKLREPVRSPAPRRGAAFLFVVESLAGFGIHACNRASGRHAGAQRLLLLARRMFLAHWRNIFCLRAQPALSGEPAPRNKLIPGPAE